MTTTPQIVIMTDAEMDQLTTPDKDDSLGALVTDKGPLPLKGLDVQAQLEGLIAEIVLTQTFVNTHAQPLEATYIFPLPDRAALTSFRLEVAGRVVEGLLKERGQARQDYDEAIEAGHRAAITEEERPGVFSIRVGNLPAGESATVRLSMVGPLAYDAGEVTFRFPLVVAPRYIPGNPLDGRSVGDGVAVDTDAVPDASRITPPVLLPGYPHPVRFTMAVNVQPAGLPLGNFRSSLHAVANEQMADGTTRFKVQAGERVNRDFILRYQIGAETVKSSLTVVPDADAKGGTFVFNVVPPARKPQSKPRKIVFVLDRSGSMDGWKMVAARRALGRMIDSLTDRDSFTVLAFDNETEMPALCGESLLSATDRHRFRVIEWLAKIEARGGTELAQPLDLAVSQLAADDAVGVDRVLVLLTDGQVGNEDQILQALAARLHGMRIFTLGIDQAVNEAFLRRLAGLGGGSCDVVESEDRLDEVMDKVQRRISAPVMTALAIKATGLTLDADSQVPARLPDLFAGTPLTILGRYSGAGVGKVVLTAKDDAGRAMTESIEARLSANHAVAKMWARGRLRDLEDQWVVVGYQQQATLQPQIVALSLQFGVLCRFTAYVAVDRSETVNQGGNVQQLTQPVELPQGWEMSANTAQAVVSKAQAAAVSELSRVFSPALNLRAASPAGGFSQSFNPSCSIPYAPSGMPPTNGGEEYCMADGESEEPFKDGEFEQEELCQELIEADSPPDMSFTNGDDLTAYRERARQMLEEFNTDDDLAHALGVLAVNLQALLDDARSTGASGTALQPLTELLQEIQAMDQNSFVSQLEKMVMEWREKVERILAEFAQGETVN